MSFDCPNCGRHVYRSWLGMSTAGTSTCDCGAELFWFRETQRWEMASKPGQDCVDAEKYAIEAASKKEVHGH